MSEITNEYIHGALGNDPVLELTMSLELIRTFLPKDFQHPTCRRETERVKFLIRQIANENLYFLSKPQINESASNQANS